MSKTKSSKRVYDSDGEAPPAKRGKATTAKTIVTGEALIDKDGDPYWELSNNRRVSVTAFKGKQMVNIREFYEKDGQQLPGKKGITLPIDQFTALLSILPQIETTLQDRGIDVPRPEYGSSGADGTTTGYNKADGTTEKEDEENDEEEVETAKPTKTANGSAASKLDQFKLDKQNHEATSDEDD
ncbi:RNA polymerase II transcriptional coactivator-like protein [Elsinoe australis]|uniref:RNA polymerase II transcriptional coactivator-like protein n=1 Tax=Elsinoe australis TaxID=40998 RepID=A0A4V6DU10_9PEZI|nr:RNA polymerase II transcriptional coactivator-like protein [Elsinoe australis]